MTELWIRNPSGCIREVIEAGITSITWDMGYLVKRKINVEQFMTTHMPVSMDYEYLLIDNAGSRLYNQSEHVKPLAVYPTWDAEIDDMSLLEELCANPVYNDEKLCNDESIPIMQRPVLGQANRIVVHNLPNMQTLNGKRFLTTLHDIQEEYGVELFVHGLYSFMPVINLKFAAFDSEPRSDAAKGKVYLPNGRTIKVAQDIHRHMHWVSLLGYTRAQLNIPRERCVFNIKAVKFATLHGTKQEVFASERRKAPTPDPVVSDKDFRPAVYGRPLGNMLKVLPTDKVECDTCSLRIKCKLYREGSVCTLPESDMKSLADMFNTTDSKTILAGLGRLTALSASRVEQAMAFEVNFGLDPEVTKLIRDTFSMAERYAKLNDPALRATVNLNRNQNVPPGVSEGVELTRLDSKTVARQAIEYFAELGIAQEDITSEMMRDYLAKVAGIGLPTPELASGEPIPAEIVEDGA